MNLEYTNFKKRFHILINIHPGDQIDKITFQSLYQSVGGLILHVDELLKFSENELINYIQLLYIPIFIQKDNYIYLITRKIKKAFLKFDKNEIIKSISLLKKEFAIIEKKSFIFQFENKFQKNKLIYLYLKNLETFSSYFKTLNFIQTYSGFVLDFCDYQNNPLIVNTLKKYFS